MRIVATSDTHHMVDVSKIPLTDVFIHAGDIMRTGYPNEWPMVLEWLAALPHKIKLLTMGNHDAHIQIYPGPALQDLRRIGVTVVGFPGNKNFDSVVLPNGMRVLGLPYVMGLPRWSFNISEPALQAHLYEKGKVYNDIVVSHSPIKGILDGDGSHSGIGLYRAFLREYKPRFWFCGHSHMGYGHHLDEESGCNIYNVAMCNEEYVHTNPPVIIDV